MSLRHVFLFFLASLILAPVRGQETAGSSIASMTVLSADSTKMFVERVYDKLTLTYDGNRLAGVSETASDYDFTGSFEYKRSNGSQYIYNSNGSLVADRSRGIAYIAYDLNNNPSRIYFTNGNEIRYTYSATGEKLCAKYYNAVPNVTRGFGVEPEGYPQSQIMCAYQYDYLLGGSLVMYNGMIDKVLFDGGYAKGSPMSSGYGFTLYYYNKDHLGNNREMLNASGTVQQVTNYYPFGAPYADPAAVQGSSLQPYKYNGKELELKHGLNTYDYGARQYDPILCRWDRMDPLCEKYYPISPYAYCANNPVKFVDPDGKKIVIWYGPKGNEKSFLFSGFHGKNSIRVPNDPFIKAVIQAYLFDCKNGGGEAFKKAIQRKEKIYIDDARIYTEGYNRFSIEGHQPTVHWNPNNGITVTEGGAQSPATILEHELDHGNSSIDSPKNHRERRGTYDAQFDNEEEKRVITGSEAKTAQSNGEAIRKDHRGIPFRTVSPISTQPAN